MVAELGVFALALALMLCLLPGMFLATGRMRHLVAPAASLSALLIYTAFALLMTLRLDSDFTVSNVADNSNRALPILYKIAGTWGNHEGSMLLFALVLAGFGALLARRNIHAAAVQSLLTAGIVLFILATSNPFTRIFPPPAEGKMLNPLLQDIALAMHPPMLYLGYVGFSSVFSLALAGLLTGKLGREWAERAHPWIMFSWASLTLGIALGSWWAYRELGWGGFWFWDPVENASLLPWLAGTALLHSNVVLKKRGLLAGWVALLAIVTFGMSLIGTFLVRSGAVTSVHSFASDPERGLYILAYIAIAIGGGLAMYGARIKHIVETAPLRPASREGVIVVNNLFLLTACATVLLGTIYPMLVPGISVGAPYFNATFLPLMAIPLVFAGIAPFMPWKKAALLQAVVRAWPAWLAAVAMFVLVRDVRAACGLALAAFLMLASAQWLIGGKWKMLASWPVFLGHMGAALAVLAITCAGLWGQMKEGYVAEGESLAIAGFEVTLAKTDAIATPNYKSTQATLAVKKSGEDVATLTPEYRHYALRGSVTSEAAIRSTPAYDLYAVIGEKNDAGKTALRLYYKPAIGFLWLGALVIAAGGLLAALLGITIQRRA